MIATHLFVWNQAVHLVLVDSYSGWFEFDKLKLGATTSNSVIRKLEGHFARFGVPDVLYSDNGLEYASEEFRQFSKKWGFKHITSSPEYPQSNGLVKRAVRSAKEMLERCRRDGSSVQMAHSTTEILHVILY